MPRIVEQLMKTADTRIITPEELLLDPDAGLHRDEGGRLVLAEERLSMEVEAAVRDERARRADMGPVLLVDDVASCFFDRASGSGMAFPDDFPIVAPPWDRFVVEWAWPENVRAEHPWLGRAAVAIETIDPARFDSGKRQESKAQRLAWLNMVLGDGPEGVPADLVVAHGAKWLLFCDGWVQVHGELKRLGGLNCIAVDGDGSPVGRRKLAKATLPNNETWAEEVEIQNLGIALLALTFANCKNGGVAKGPQARKFNRARARSGKPLLGYYVLDIRPMKGQERGVSSQPDSMRALHVRRGYFGDYRHGSGLFGKHKGVYWWGPALRGSIELGAVEKDYRIKVA